MASERHFLGWDGPMLTRAARWLAGRYGAAMGHVTVVLPAGRAKRRLLELLVEEMTGEVGDDAAEGVAETSKASAGDSGGSGGGGGAWEPPTLVTVGELPELLYDVEGGAEGGEGVAGELEAMVARVHALRTAGSDMLRPVVPHPPERGDMAGWWALAESLHRLDEELAAARLRVAEVAGSAAERGIDLGLGATRWAALAAVEARYRQTLGKPDVQVARRAAIRDGTCRGGGPVVLVGVVDLTLQASAMLEQAAGAGEGGGAGEVHALIQAPDEHAAGFDTLGGLVVEYWRDRPVPVERATSDAGIEAGAGGGLHWADRPRDEAVAVVRRLAELDGEAADAVTVGLGDEARAGTLARAIDLAGTPARFGGGTPTLRSRPARLLDALAGYLQRGRFNDLATLVRHPDLAAWLGGGADWLTRLDRHASVYLQADVHEPWPGDDPGRARLSDLRDRLDELAPADHHRPRALPAWSEPILFMLTELYGRVTLDRHRDHGVVVALQQLAHVLRDQATLDPAAEVTPRVTLAEALRLTLRQLADTAVPDPGGDNAVELVGFLELPLDDAPHVVVTGLNEGHVPASRNADAFLPDALRSALGLPDNARRFARDKLLLTTILHGRDSVTLTACRRSADDEPLAPSRLLLACDDDTLAARLRSFYAPEPARATPRPSLLTPGGVNRFVIPRPLLDHPPITSLSATKFKAYLTCPYRFYLAHVLGLDAVDDRAVELDPLAFGSLAHTVLQRFAATDAADATSPEVIETALNGLLDEAVAGRVGRGSRVAVRVQVEQLRERLRHFAEHQAAEAQGGWRICRDRVEQDYEATVTVDGEPFTVTGRIDRIDHHPHFGYRLLDYKTSDAGDEPNRTHRRAGRWVDLQLPLYLGLVAETGIGAATLGYVNLAKSPDKAGVRVAKWTEDDLAAAEAARDDVIRGLRAQRYWPPSDDLPRWDDAFVRVAADRAVDRPELVRGDA